MTGMLNTHKVNNLLPVLAMAGQVGAAIAVLIKTRNLKLKDTAKSGLVPGVLGVGEPLIYGGILPLGKRFLGAVGGDFSDLFQVGALGYPADGGHQPRQNGLLPVFHPCRHLVHGL